MGNELKPLFSLIRHFEGCYLTPYYCPAGVLTAGWGATGHGVFPGEKWTQEQADARLEDDVAYFAQRVRKLVPGLSGDRFCAVTDFAFNCGVGNLKASTFLKRVIAHDWADARVQLMRWTRGGGRVLPGLVKRRAAEAALL